MNQKILFGTWFVLTILATLLVSFLRHQPSSSTPKKLSFGFGSIGLKEVFDLALAMAGGDSGGYVIIQTFFNFDELQKLVGFEGCVAMVLGGGASIWFSGGKVKELVAKP